MFLLQRLQEKGQLSAADFRRAEEAIAANPTVVADYKSGKVALLQFLVGQGMKASKGSANPQVLSKLIQELLS